MVTIREVKTKKDIKEFIEFPLRLYKGCEWFVPPLYGDEKKMILEGGRPDIADSIFLLAERDGKTVGRIQGIVQRQYNELHSTKRVRFTRFDSINDTEISNALFGAVEEWGRSFGMTELCGPLGYSDLDREGLLIEGFEELCLSSMKWMIGECAEEFETLPLLQDVDILRNVLYSGCWMRYHMKRAKEEKKKGRPEE